MRICPACAATSPADSAWCGQCFTPLPAVAEADRLTRPLVGAGAPAGINRFGLSEAPPVDRVDPTRAVALPVHAETARPMLSGSALALVAIAIGIGIVATVVSWALGHNDRLEPATYIRYAIVLTLGVYVLVGGLIVTRLVPGVSLRWHRGRPARSILVGAVYGVALGAGMVWLVTTASGHLGSDARFVTVMSEGDVAHIVVGFGIAVVCAPLVEETLFRGLLLESMRARSATAALLTSAVCFALWHLNIAVVPLVYYSLMGCMLGRIYMKRGLAGSMAAHAAFNGVLTVAALAIVLAPATTITSGGISIKAPGGWRQHTGSEVGGGLVLEGPSESALLVQQEPSAATPTTATMLARLQAGLLSVDGVDLGVDASSAREVKLPAGPAVEVDITAQGHAGTLVYLPRPGAIVEVVFMSGGSLKARSDFPGMVESLRVS
ncbi:MAG TPA: type II CAAX endopeptidase family protein [Mycobacteriales bacterium]|nr:type II CAAX endopeptidase family protein [Mycobacteriales bacterium]